MDFLVKVVPKSSKTELVGYLPDGTWKVFLAERFGVPQSKVEILSGATGRLKRIRVREAS